MIIEITMKDEPSGLFETLKFTKEFFVDSIRNNPDHLLNIIEDSNKRFMELGSKGSPNNKNTNTQMSLLMTTACGAGAR